MNKKALIFGVTGQDGSHLADLLLTKGYQVVGISRRTSTDNKSRIQHLSSNKNFSLEECDITDAHSVYWTLDKHDDADEIYNLAAQSFVGISFKQPGLTWDVTGKGCLNILQSIVDLKLHARFYQASSSEMFGANYEYCDGVKYQDEDTKFLPQSPYAIAKCAAHYMTRLYREAYGLHASAGILFNHEGPRRGEQFVTRKITKWIGDFSWWIQKNAVDIDEIKDCNRTDSLNYDGESFPKLKLGNIEAYRDWGYAPDFCEAMWLMLQQESPDDYVICTGETHTVKEFLEIAFEHAGLGDWSKYITIDHELYRPAEVDYLRGNCTKANNVLEWKPKHGFKELVRIMVDSDISGC